MKMPHLEAASVWSYLLLTFLFLAQYAMAEETCATYIPERCFYAANISSQLTKASCAPGGCNFNQKKDFKCGFPETGSYDYTPIPDGGCKDPFMSMRRRGLQPCGSTTSGGRCCRADIPGNFTPIGKLPGAPGSTRYMYQPLDAACEYAQVTRGQIIHHLNTRGAPIVIFGDSMMRQLFLRMVMMMRGQQRLLDPHMQTHAQFAMCKEADAFRVLNPANSSDPEAATSEGMISSIATFFPMYNGTGIDAARLSLARCSRRPIHIDFVWAPFFSHQANMIPKYLESLPPGVKPIMISSVGYWENSYSQPPERYLDALAAAGPKARQVLMVSVPTVKLRPLDYEAERVVRFTKRNLYTQKWVKDHGEPFYYVDFDTLSNAPVHPPTGGGTDKHYICSVLWKRPCHGCPAVRLDHTDGTWIDGELQPQMSDALVGSIHMSEDGRCTDETNRAVWSIVLNTVLGRD